jgi:flagellar biosynthesis/type III secretory pathway chaperone
MPGIAELLDREISLVSAFVDLLNQEQDALKAAVPDALPEIQEKKMSLVEALNQASGARIAAIAGQGMPEQAAMAEWLAKQNSASTALAASWQKLLELAREAKTLHQLNGQLVQMHLKRTEDALAILTQRQQENLFYGSNGQAATYTGSRIVDSA